MKIDLPLTGHDGKVFKVVRAELIDVSPHIECATFAVHKHIGWAGMQRGWSVSNVETGFMIYHTHADTKAGSVQMARRVLATKSNSEVVSSMRKAGRMLK